MKKYQKPAMLALSLSANDNLCGTCSYSTREHKDELEYLKWTKGVEWNDNGDGVIAPGESNVFGYESSCQFQLEDYCKYTAADSGLLVVFTS